MLRGCMQNHFFVKGLKVLFIWVCSLSCSTPASTETTHCTPKLFGPSPIYKKKNYFKNS